MGKVRKMFFNLPEITLALLAICITIVVFFELFVREVFGVSVFGITGELTRLFMVWLSMLGAAVAVKRGAHFVFPLIADRLGSKAAPYLSILSALVVMAVAVLFIAVGLKVAILSANEHFISIRISIFWENLAIPVSGVLIFLYSVNPLKNQISSIKDVRKAKSGYKQDNQT